MLSCPKSRFCLTVRGLVSGRSATVAAWFLVTSMAPAPAHAQGNEIDTRILAGHRSEVFVSIAFRADSEVLASCDGSNVFKLWDLASDRAQELSSPGSVFSLAFTDDGLATGGGYRHPDSENTEGQVLLWSDAGMRAVEYAPSRVLCVAAAGGKLAAGGATWNYETGQETGVVKLWRDNNASPARFLEAGLNETYHSIAFSPDGEWLVAGSGREEDENLGKLTFWNVTQYSNEVVAQFRGVVYAVAVSRDGKGIAYAGVKITDQGRVGFVTLREVSTGRESTLAGAPYLRDPVTAVAFSGEGSIAVGTGSAVLAWKEVKDEPVRLATSALVRSIAFSPDSKMLAAGCEDAKIFVWTRRAQDSVPATPKAVTLTVSVVDAAELTPLRDATVRVIEEGARRTGNAEDGVFVFSLPSPGKYTVEVARDGYETQKHAIAAPEAANQITFALKRSVETQKPVQLTVSVVDGNARDAPLQAATVRVVRVSTGEVLAEVRRGTGIFSAPGPGQYKITVSHAGYEGEQLTLEVGAADVDHLVRLKRTAPAPQPLTLRVRVVESSSSQELPVTDATVRVTGATQKGGGADGTYACVVPKAGTYEVSVTKQGYVPQKKSVRVAADGHEATIALERKLALTIVGAEKDPLGDCTVVFPSLKAQPKPLQHGGALHFALDAGTYKVTVSREGYVSATAEITIGSKVTTKEVVLIRAQRFLIVRVLEDERPLGGLAISAPDDAAATEPAPGSYRIRLAPGEYEIEASVGGTTFGSQQLTIASKDVTLDLRSPPKTSGWIRQGLDVNADRRVNADDFDPAAWAALSKFDKNGDRQLDEGECEATAKAPPTAARWLQTPPAGQPGAGSVPSLGKDDLEPEAWNALQRYDANRNQRLEAAELPRGAAPAPARWPFSAPQELDALADWVLKQADTNGNGCIDAGDYEEGAWSVVGIYDANGDGQLSKDEIRDQLRKSHVDAATTASRGTLTIKVRKK